MDEIEEIGERSAAAADVTARAFEEAAERIGTALEGAARTGELSFERLAESILTSLARTAITDLIAAPLNAAIGQAFSQQSTGQGALTVNMNLGAATDAKAFARSGNQIAASVARAVRMGSRNL